MSYNFETRNVVCSDCSIDGMDSRHTTRRLVSTAKETCLLNNGSLGLQRDSFFFFNILSTIFLLDNLKELDKVDGHARAVTGPSLKEGRNSPITSRGNSSPTVSLHSSKNRWVPSSELRREAKSTQDKNELIFRTVRSILNKLTPENFISLSVELLNVGISSKFVLKGIVILIFDKSIDEPRYSTLYANLCYRLYHEAPNFDPPPQQPINAPPGSTLRPNTFRRLLIAKLQDEFENRNRKLEAFDSKIGPLDAGEEEQRILSKHHMLGNIKFIGELYRLSIIQESIMHKCIKQLINKKKKGTLADLAEDLECLSQIMTTCGKRLDHPKAKSLMDQYFERMEVLRKKHSDLPSRIRFMLQDVDDLRRSDWVPRRAKRDVGPKPLEQIRHEVQDTEMQRQFGDGYGRGNQRYQQAQATGLGSNSGFQMKNYGMSSNRGGRYSQSPQYQGNHGTTPAMPPSFKTASPNDFDFFGPVRPQQVRPAAPKPSMNLPRPMYPGQQMRFAAPIQPHPSYNGHPKKTDPALTRSTVQNDGFFSSYDKFNAPQQQQMKSEPRPTNLKPDKKPGKEIPPRFQKHQMTGSLSGNKEQNAGKDGLGQDRTPTDPNPWNKSKHPSAFSPLQTEPAKARQLQPKQPSPITQSIPLGVTKNGSKAPAHSANRPRSDASLPSLRLATQNRRSSPTIRQTNVDAIQAPFQHAIDNAPQQAPLSKKNVSVNPEKLKNKKSLSQLDVENIADEILEKYFAKIKTQKEVGKWICDLKIQRKHMPILITKAILKSFLKPGEEKERISKLFEHLLEAKICDTERILEGVQAALEKMSDSTDAASLFARFIINEVISLSGFGEILVEGYKFPIFLLTLQEMSKLKGQDWIVTTFKDSKIDMIKMMPEGSQSKGAMIKLLEENKLEYLFPLVDIEFKLANQIAENSNPTSIYKWIKENVETNLHSDPEFINILVSCCLDHVTKSSSLASDVDRTAHPNKEIKEKERQLLVEIKPVLQKFLYEKRSLQLHALYSTQVFCCDKDFPKGLLLRIFNGMYEEDIIEEETYYLWKEDVNEMYPGKGKALFQVNAWLTWLHEAETDEED